jgi:7-cyano-7-deazaguanine synthase
MPDTVVLASGGINSLVVAVRARPEGSVSLLHVDYGQPSAAGQRAAVRAQAEAIGAACFMVEFPQVPKIAAVRRSASGRLSTDPRNAPPIGPVAQVPALAAGLLSSAVQLAFRVGAEVVQSGASEHANEIETESAPGGGTPDHRREFFYLSNLMFEQLQRSRTPIRIDAPLIDLSRGEIIKLGHRDQAPFDLTYSCRAARDAACGECPSCIARARAFAEAKLSDPALAGTRN